jgi:hypothetical protein
MKLLHLKIACYLYNQFTDYDDSFLKLSTEYPNLDLNEKEHIKALIKWLRSWGCRQFKCDNENTSIESIISWYSSIKSKIPRNDEYLIDYNLVNNKDQIIKIFDSLKNSKAATRQKRDVCIGPVGTAKTLFALRPNLFSPWDTLIYQHWKLEGNGDGYVNYLTIIQNDLKAIREAIQNTNISWNNLFNYLEKKHNSYAKLIDEYYWITITKRCDPLFIENICKY